jgi:two-component system, chemotaxis family, protein-glutamate methylesterase/glutaminase
MSIRVLVVDDSAVVRRLLGRFLDEEDDFEVVGKARNGEHALARVAELKPDVVTMDVEMPVLDGVEAVRRLRVDHPRLPIVMVSSHTERGSKAALEALMAGATAYVSKRSEEGEGLKGIVHGELAPRLREAWRAVRGLSMPEPVSQVSHGPRLVAPTILEQAPWRQRGPRGRRIDAVLIGSSTGGPNALAQVLPDLPGDLGVPVLIVQHMPPRFTRLLADRLDGSVPLHVREGQAGDPVEPGLVYIAPGGYHMRVRRAGDRVSLTLDREPPVHSCRPAVDCLFGSAVDVWGGRLLACVLTGMGADGRDGARRIHGAGGYVIAQDEATSVVWGMPRAVHEAGVADEVLPLEAVAEAISRRVWLANRPRAAGEG